MTAQAKVLIRPADQRSAQEIGEDALALLLADLPVSMALLAFDKGYRAGEPAREAMRHALQAAQLTAAWKWKRTMEGSNIILAPEADLARAKARRLGELQGRSILLSAKLSGALALLRSGKPEHQAEGVAAVEAAMHEAQEIGLA